MKLRLKKIKCPCCNGTGNVVVEIIEQMSRASLGEFIKKMQTGGMSLRQIAKVIGVNGPQSVKHYRDYET